MRERATQSSTTEKQAEGLEYSSVVLHYLVCKEPQVWYSTKQWGRERQIEKKTERQTERKN